MRSVSLRHIAVGAARHSDRSRRQAGAGPLASVAIEATHIVLIRTAQTQLPGLDFGMTIVRPMTLTVRQAIEQYIDFDIALHHNFN